MGVPGIVPLLVRVWSCVNRTKWQGSCLRSERNSDQRRLYMQPVSVLCICVCVSHNEMTDIDLSGVVPSEALLHFDSLCLHNTSHGKRAHLRRSSHNSHGFLLLDRGHYMCSNRCKKADWMLTLKRNKSIGTVNGQIILLQLTGQVACEWWTHSQVNALWVKDTFILDTSWANKERERKEKRKGEREKSWGGWVQDSFPAQQELPLKIPLTKRNGAK